MARGSGIRRRSRQMRRGGKIGAAGAAVMEARSGGQVKVGGGRLGQVVVAGSTDFEVDKSSSAGSAEEGWIYVRVHRIEKAGLHIDPDGNVYVPDSEDEESGMDQACARHVSTGMELAMDLKPPVRDEATVGAAGVEMATDVAEDQAAHKDLPVHKPLVLATDEDLRMKVPTEVPDQLKEVLANMDPIYHEVFVSMNVLKRHSVEMEHIYCR